MEGGWIASLKGRPQDTGLRISWYERHVLAFLALSLQECRVLSSVILRREVFELANPPYLWGKQELAFFQLVF